MIESTCFLPLLKSHLKSDLMLDLLEMWDAQVIYEYDRSHENMPDEYWASIYGEGVRFRFNDQQILDCIFLHLTDADGFSPIDLSSTDIPHFRSLADVAVHAKKKGLGVSSGQGELFGESRDWVKLECKGHSIHYEFRDDDLALVTLTAC